MNLTFDSIKNTMASLIPNVVFTTEENISFNMPIVINQIEFISSGIDSTYGEYVEYKISDGRGRIKDNYNLVFYEGNINDINTVKIISHILIGNEDHIKCTGVSDFIIDGTMPVEKITFDLKNLIYCEWEYVPVATSLGTRAYSYAEGIRIDFMIKTKEDNNRERIDLFVDTIRNKCMSNLMNFSIMSKDTIPIKIGNFKALDKPHVSKIIREGGNIQTRTVSIIGTYMFNYKK